MTACGAGTLSPAEGRGAPPPVWELGLIRPGRAAVFVACDCVPSSASSPWSDARWRKTHTGRYPTTRISGPMTGSSKIASRNGQTRLGFSSDRENRLRIRGNTLSRSSRPDSCGFSSDGENRLRIRGNTLSRGSRPDSCAIFGPGGRRERRCRRESI